jgi:hypothetical protein
VALKLREGLSKNDVKNWFRSTLSQQRPQEEEEQMLEGSVRLVSRLITMVDTGPIPYGTQGCPTVDWIDGATTLQGFLASYFQRCASEKAVSTRFSVGLTAYNLRQYTGINVVWTDNLADHLRLINDDKELCIFPHVTFLKSQSRYDLLLYTVDYSFNAAEDFFPMV